MRAEPIRSAFEASSAGKALEYVDSIQVGSAEQFYAMDYLTCRVMGMERPKVEEYGLGVRVAEALRQQIDDRLPAEARS